MTKRNLKRIRNLRITSSLTMIALILLSFQNCAPSQMCADGSSDCSTESTGSSRQPSSSGGGTSLGSGSGGSSGNGSSLGGGSSSGGSSGGSLGGGGSTGGSNNGGGGLGGGSGIPGGSGGADGTFRITRHPSNTNVNEFADFSIDVVVSGGKTPYSYQWYKDAVPLNAAVGNFFSYYDTADSWQKEGFYHVVIKDAAGASLKSNAARVSIAEPAVGCPAGRYFTFTNAQYDFSSMIPGFLDSPRGKHLLHETFPNASFISQIPRNYTGLRDYTFAAMSYLGKAYINCRTSIPKIHTPEKNPAYGNDREYMYGDYAYMDSSGYKYEGAVNFECRNKKLRLVTNTCKWVKVQDDYDRGRN